ncbi:MAG: Diguanylate cyclase [Tardiphaga sp.]|nr:Diguanylate cyclase [Tardiphaga sp.]
MSRVPVEAAGGWHRRAISAALRALGIRLGPIQYLILCGGILIMAIGAGTVLAAIHYRERAIQSTERELENTVLLVTRHFDEKLGDLQGVQNDVIDLIQTTLAGGKDAYRATMSSYETHQKFRTKLNTLPYVGALNLFDSEGWLINSSEVWPPPPVTTFDRRFFRAFKSGTETTPLVVEPTISRVTGAWTAVFVRKLTSPTGEFIGTLHRGVEPSHFENYFASLALGQYATISMLHRDGTMLARYPRDESLIGQDLSGSPIFQSLIRAGGRATGRFISPVDGVERLGAARQLTRFPLLITATTTMSAALEDWREQTKLQFAGAALAVLVIAITLFLIVRELSRQHRASHEMLVQKSRHLDTAIDNMTQGLLLLDANGRLIVRNRRYLDMFGLSGDDIKPGCHLRDLLTRRQQNGTFLGDIDEYCANFLRQGPEGTIREAIFPTPDGRAIQVVYKNSSDGGFTSTLEDVTERQRTEARITRLAHYDALTDLPNRVLFRQQLEGRIKALESGERFATLYVDVDEFKGINDSLGHQAGDELLKAVANRLRDCVGAADFVARLGGDEFAIILTRAQDDTNRDDVVPVLERIYEAIRKPFECLGHQITTDVSIGVALAPEDGADLDQLLKHADLAMYRAKTEGRRTWRFFERSMEASASARRSIEADLRRAMAEGGFELHYQPVVDLSTNEVTGCEALLRWRHAERGMISPAEFIPVAEHTGLIIELGEWVLHTACAEAATWPDPIRLAVNVSPVQFRTGTLALKVASALAASGLPADRLEIEITEAVLIRDDDAALAVLHQLRDLGVHIALDDFGTGYSSLSYLQRFPFDKIKIDRSFIRDITESGGSSSIVRAVVNIATEQNMVTTAEGVETQQQLDLLRALGCNQMQGFLFSPARPAGEIRGMLRGESVRQFALFS